MARKKYIAQTDRPGPDGQRKSVKRPAHRLLRWWLAIALIVIGVFVLIFGQLAARQNARRLTQHQGVNHQASGVVAGEKANTGLVPGDYGQGDTAWDPTWPPLPASAGPPPRSIEMVRAAYAFAARRQDVMQYVPCYCGCERQGHNSVHDYFVKDQTPARVKRWDAMGYT